MPLQERLKKKPVARKRYDFSKKCVCSLNLNDPRVDCRSYGCWNVVPAPLSGNRKSAVADTLSPTEFSPVYASPRGEDPEGWMTELVNAGEMVSREKH